MNCFVTAITGSGLNWTSSLGSESHDDVAFSAADDGLHCLLQWLMQRLGNLLLHLVGDDGAR